jgi:hypothetical protein
MVRSPFHEQRLPPAERTRHLTAVLERAAERSGGAPVVVFDLDGTLMDNRPRMVAILRELGEEWRRGHPHVASLLERASLETVVYDFEASLERLGIADKALHLLGLEFWKARFFNDPHLRHDVEVPGARAYVRALHDAGATVVYLTGRDLPNMALGTFARLRDLGFPIGLIGTELVVKPTFHMSDMAFKRSVLPEFPRLGRLIASFDNEPANCNLFAQAYAECATLFVDTQCASDPPPLDPRVKVIDSFEREA